MYRTAAEVIEEFKFRGISAAEWARVHGFKPCTVYQVLRSRDMPTRGQSHRIAVALGMKAGDVSGDFDLSKTKLKGDE